MLKFLGKCWVYFACTCMAIGIIGHILVFLGPILKWPIILGGSLLFGHLSVKIPFWILTGHWSPPSEY